MNQILTHSVSFLNNQGLLLSGKIDQPENTKAYAIFAHHFAGSKDVLAASRISRRLAQHDIAVLRFDFTGLGNSQGEFKDTTFEHNIQDIIAAANFLQEQYQAPQLLLGHSLGGAAILAAATYIPSVNAVTTIGAPCEPAHLSHIVKESEKLEKEGYVIIEINHTPIVISKGFIESIKKFDMSQTLKQLSSAVMVMHSPVDEIVHLEHAKILYNTAKHPKSFIALDKANHLLTNAKDTDFVADIVAVWAERYFKDLNL